MQKFIFNLFALHYLFLGNAFKLFYMKICFLSLNVDNKWIMKFLWNLSLTIFLIYLFVLLKLKTNFVRYS